MERIELMNYTNPTLRVVELTPEKGFATSPYGEAGGAGNDLTNEDEWNF